MKEAIQLQFRKLKLGFITTYDPQRASGWHIWMDKK